MPIVGATIIDLDDDRFVVGEIGHEDPAMEGECLVRCGQGVLVEALTRCGLASVKARAVPRGMASRFIRKSGGLYQHRNQDKKIFDHMYLDLGLCRCDG